MPLSRRLAKEILPVISAQIEENEVNMNNHRTSTTPGNAFDDNESILYGVVKDAGRWVANCVMVEVWIQTDDDMLQLVKDGFWIDPVFHQGHHHFPSGNVDDCPICKLVDSQHPSYIPPASLAPGEGLEGYLWSRTVEGSFPRRRSSVVSIASASLWTSSRSLMPEQEQHHHSPIVWRDIKSLAMDPHQPYNVRLKAFAQADLGMAAAVPFLLDSRVRGMVVYINKDPDPSMSEDSFHYLRRATHLIGSVWAFQHPRQVAMSQRQQRVDNAFRQVRSSLLHLRFQGVDMKEHLLACAGNHGDQCRPQRMRSRRLSSATATKGKGTKLDVGFGVEDGDDHSATTDGTIHGQIASRTRERFLDFTGKLKTVWKKSIHGGGVQPPPLTTLRECCFIFVGILCSLLSVTFFNEVLRTSLGHDYSIPLGPFGALITLQFCLTAAPAAQPLNALAGQVVALSVSLAVTTFLEAYCEVWIRQSIATSLTIVIMSLCGVVHPPAGASAIVFATGRYNWKGAVGMLLGNLIATFISTLINNLRNKRQYPTYWGTKYAVKGVMSTVRSTLAPILRLLVPTACNSMPPIKPSTKFVRRGNPDEELGATTESTTRRQDRT